MLYPEYNFKNKFKKNEKELIINIQCYEKIIIKKL